MDMFKKISFVRFCYASASMLQEDLGLTTEKLICLNKECIELAKNCNDIHIMMVSCFEFVLHSNSIGRHADSLRCLKEILPSAVVEPEAELIVHKYLSLTYKELKEIDNVVLHAKKWIEIARKIGDKENEVHGYHEIGNAFFSEAHYDDAIDYYKKCLELSHEICSTKDKIMVRKSIMYACKRAKKYDDTILYAHKLLDFAIQIKDQKAMMIACAVLGTAHLALNHYQDATDYVKKCIDIAREIQDRCHEVQAYLLMGEVHEAFSDYETAIFYCKKCIELAINIGDKQAEAKAYSVLGRICYFLGKYDDAISNCNKCLYIDKEDNEEKAADANAHLTLGEVNQSLKKYDEAIQNFKQCIDIVKRIGHEKKAGTSACFALGKIYKTLEQYDDAVHYYKKCIDLAQETGEKSIEAQACFLLSSLYETLNEKDNAIQYGKKCIELAQETGENTIGAQACLDLSFLYQTLDEKDNAIQYGKKCIDLAQETGEKSIAAQACFLLSSLYEALDEKDNAIQYSKKCIEIAQKTGKKTIEAQACFLLSLLYETLGENDNAIQYGKKCIEIAQETGDKKSEMDGHSHLARVYLYLMQLNDVSLSIDAGMEIATELGDKDAEVKFKEISSNLYLTVGMHDKAYDVPSIKEVVEVPTCSEDNLLEDLAQAMKTDDKRKKHSASVRLYRFYSSKKEHEKAIHCLEQLKEMNINLSVNVFCFIEIGGSYRLMGQNDMALRSFKEGLPTAESCSNNMLRSEFYYGIGKLLFLFNGELTLAKRYLKESIRCFEAIFTTLGTRDEFKISIFDYYNNCYKLLTLLLVIGQQIEEALLLLDRSRARALKDLMITNYKMKQEGSNDEHLEYSDALSLVSKSDFSISYYSICFDFFLKFHLGGEATMHFAAHPNVISTDDFLRIYVDTLFDEMNVRGMVNCEDRSLDKEQNIQTEQKRCIEEYEGINQAFASLLKHDSKEEESNENNAETNGSALEVLFQILECERILSLEQDEVVIIPEGPLYQVPFPALRDPCTGKYLSEAKRIRLAPSLATLKHFEDFPTDQTSNVQPLIIGDPMVEKVTMNGEQRYIMPLPGARKEAEEISLLLEVPALLKDHATKPAVIKRLQEGASVVHIAAHGILSKATILLAPSPEIRATKIPDEEDYMLTMADVQQAKVRAQLVVLSCCHSGRGEIRAEGVVGMCRAFLVSGARAVVGSLWAIEDSATLAFMKIFYGHLKNGKSASISLQLTMNEMRNSVDYKEPKYWAPFFLMGDDVALKS